MNVEVKKHLWLAIALFSLLRINANAQEKIKDFSTMTNRAFEAKKRGDYKLADSIAKDYIDTHLFKLKKQQLFTKEYLTFMSQYLGSTSSKAFKLFMAEPERINSILGDNRAQYALRSAISLEFLKGMESNSKPDFDWDILEKKLGSKFGSIGLEVLYGKQMLYYLENKEWFNFGKYYQLYFKTALRRPEYNINNISWYLFENVNDPTTLEFACDVVMKYAMEEWYQTNINAYDTYANLLYKLGRKNEAIDWEKKAVDLGKGTWKEKGFLENLEKMRNGLPTWPNPTKN